MTIALRRVRSSRGSPIRPQDIPEPDAPGPPVFLWLDERAYRKTVLVLILLVLLTAAAGAYDLRYSGSSRWSLLAMILAVVAVLAMGFLGRRARDPEALARESGPEPVAGDLRRLRVTLRRAYAGSPYARRVFEDRTRRAFLEKVRVARDLSLPEVEAYSSDPEALRSLLEDPSLARFVEESDLHAGPPPTGPIGSGFLQHLAKVMDRMEAWR